MEQRRRQLRIIGGFLVIATLAGCPILQWLSWVEHADIATGVALVLSPDRQSIRAGEVPTLTATLINRGSQEVTLVKPGDGSECAWRTPLVEWSAGDALPRLRCGNMNALQADEVFTLGSGESCLLDFWYIPRFSRPGRYSLAMRYTNFPKIVLREEAIRDPMARRMRQSTRVSTVSNKVEVVVHQ